MKNRIIVCFMSLLGLASCSDSNEELEDTRFSDGQASSSGSLVETLIDGLYDKWCAGDTILLLHDGQTAFAEAQESGNISNFTSGMSRTFTDSNPLYGIYPAGNMVSFDNESVTVSVPSVQTAKDSGFDETAAVSVARSVSESLCFQSVCGGIKLNFQMSGVTKVELESVDGYALSGKAKLKWDEQGVPVVRPKDKYWELCMTMNDSWGFQHADTNYKTPHILLRTFVDCLSMGGNLLLDIGPKEDGTIPEEQVAILKEFGRWIKKHKEAVYETRAGIPAEHFQGYTTLNKAGDILYLYLPYRPNGPIEIKGLMNKVNRVWVVGNGAMLPFKIHNKSYWSQVPGNLYIEVPERVQDEQITVLAVLLDGPIKLYRGEGQVISAN